LSDLADGFSTYTTTTKTISQEVKIRQGGSEIILSGVGDETPSRKNNDDRKAKLAQAEAVITLVKDSADILLAAEGNLVQNVLVEESVLATSANVKDALQNLLVDGPRNFRESLPFIGSVLPPSPLEKSVAPFLQKTTQEKKAQDLIGKFSTMVAAPRIPPLDGPTVDGGLPFARANDAPTSAQGIDPEQAAMVAKEVRENISRYAPLVGQLSGKVRP
jgi:hypothetical protein